MATYIKTLKEDNGDITYPQTKGSAVLLDGGSDLETVLAAKADASTVNQKITVGDVQSTDIAANAVTTAKIANSNVTTAKLANGAVTSAKIDWSTMAFGNYSTSEQDTKLTWINGAKIYKKTIVSTNLVAGENNINHGISSLGLVLKYDGLMDIGNGTTLPIPTMASVTNNSVSVWIVNSTVIRIFSSLSFTGTVYITLYYTKTS